MEKVHFKLSERLKVFNTRSHPGLDKPKKNICKNVWVSKLNLEYSIIIKNVMEIITVELNRLAVI